MKTILFSACVFFGICGGCALAEPDSLHYPSLKIFARGSLAMVTGWEPQTGKLHSLNWYEDDKVVDNSFGFHYGMIVSKSIGRSNFYACSGLEISSFSFGKFRTTDAPDLRFNHTAVDDVSYQNYELKSLHVPVYFQVPLYTKTFYFSLRAGVLNDLTYSETYTILYSEYNPGASTYSTTEKVDNPGMGFTGMRLHLGLDFEIHVRDSRFIPLLSLNYSSSPLTEKTSKENFLDYSSVISISCGLGFGFRKK